MSNKIVPAIYRSVIDDVMAAIKPEFEEYGVSEDVFAELQNKWENKVIASRVAEFEASAPPAQPATAPQHHPYPAAHTMHVLPSHPYAAAATSPYPGAPPPSSGVKAEPIDARYMLNAYALPHLPGPPLNGARPVGTTQYGGQTSVLSFPAGPASVQGLSANGLRPYVPVAPVATAQPINSASSASTTASGGGGSAGRIPQLDGPSEDESDEDDKTPPPFAPRTSHPSLPQPQASTSTTADSEAINSDLDDSDTADEEEADEGAVGETDIVFCTYDKVARVKNKWKCILKDGMIHVNGKDYLFSKCTGEFEW
ncbi:hypothetical protein D9757_008243 [Collybiopsis confluens]|uniref:Uncharacterized protein n=1 Tax=Collybiopsis confluens TaxID=2823264 RepID=A0A8H5HBY7_9AGAR|nr:hypothetical protein D9757_008243 [Collybiopsis confluens]